jgi:hypothetical protein
MTVSNRELIARIEFGINRLKTESLTAEQEAEIFRAIASIAGVAQRRNEQLLKQESETV